MGRHFTGSSSHSRLLFIIKKEEKNPQNRLKGREFAFFGLGLLYLPNQNPLIYPPLDSHTLGIQ